MDATNTTFRTMGLENSMMAGRLLDLNDPLTHAAGLYDIDEWFQDPPVPQSPAPHPPAQSSEHALSRNVSSSENPGNHELPHNPTPPFDDIAVMALNVQPAPQATPQAPTSAGKRSPVDYSLPSAGGALDAEMPDADAGEDVVEDDEEVAKGSKITDVLGESLDESPHESIPKRQRSGESVDMLPGAKKRKTATASSESTEKAGASTKAADVASGETGRRRSRYPWGLENELRQPGNSTLSDKGGDMTTKQTSPAGKTRGQKAAGEQKQDDEGTKGKNLAQPKKAAEKRPSAVAPKKAAENKSSAVAPKRRKRQR